MSRLQSQTQRTGGHLKWLSKVHLPALRQEIPRPINTAYHTPWRLLRKEDSSASWGDQVQVFSTFQDIWKKRRPESPVQSTAVWLPGFFMPQCTHQGSDCLKALIQSPSAAQPSQLQPPSLKESLHHLILLKSPQHILSQERIWEQGSPSRAWEEILVVTRLVCHRAEAWSNF